MNVQEDTRIYLQIAFMSDVVLRSLQKYEHGSSESHAQLGAYVSLCIYTYIVYIYKKERAVIIRWPK